MKIEYLDEFLALAQSGNYTSAAESVFISESTLSRHIMALEKDLHAHLFTRGAKGAALTEDGKLLLPHALRIEGELNQFKKELKRRRKADNTLSIGFGHALQQYGMTEGIFRFRREHPEVSLLLTEDKSENLWKALSAGELDFILCYRCDSCDERGTKIHELLRDHLAAVLPMGHPLYGKERIALSDLKGERFIFQSRGSTTNKLYMQLLDEVGYEPEEIIFGGDCLLDLVAQNMGVALIEKLRFCTSAPANIHFADIEPTVCKSLAMAYRDEKLTPGGVLFAEFMKQFSLHLAR